MSGNDPARRTHSWKRVLLALIAVLGVVTGMALGAPGASAATEVSLFGSTVPSNPAENDPDAVELGVTVVPTVSGTITGVRYYQGTGNGGTHTASLWNSAGTKLAAATFAADSTTGWKQVRFASPVAVAAGQRYVASYYAPQGYYAAAGGFFTSPYTSGNLTVPADGGVYRYGASGYPTSTYNTTNYYVDVLFNATTSTDTTAPVLSAVTSSAVSDTTATISWTSNEAATGQVGYGTSTAYGSTTTADPALTTAHRQTLTGLTPSTTYHYQVRSADAAGNQAKSSDLTFTTAVASSFNPGNLSGGVAIPAGLAAESTSSPTTVVGTGTAASCTSAAVVAAVTKGGVVTFNCGSAPTTITLNETLKVRNSTAKLVLDGGGKVTLSGGGTRRILYIDTCDTSLGSVSGNCLYAPSSPNVTVQNITLTGGNATDATGVVPGGDGRSDGGGGAIFALGGRLKVYRTVFTRNTCASNGPDLGGGAIRVLAQNSPTPNDLDSSYAARNQYPVAVVQSTFGGASGQGNSCSNGGAISTLRTPSRVINAKIRYNNAVGCCANPPKSGTPGGGSGGAMYSDGNGYDVSIAGSDLQYNTAKAGGSSIFFVSNNRTGHLTIDHSVSKNNTYAASGQSTPQSFQNYPGIFYLGSGTPTFTDSTIQ